MKICSDADFDNMVWCFILDGLCIPFHRTIWEIWITFEGFGLLLGNTFMTSCQFFGLGGHCGTLGDFWGLWGAFGNCGRFF